MSKSKNDGEKKDLESQPDTTSENEETDSVTDHSSSTSENATHTQSDSKCSESSKTASATTATPRTATQFSVERSDVDGLRMKISAIRPAKTTDGGAPPKEEKTERRPQPKERQPITKDNNNSVDKLNPKLGMKCRGRKAKQPNLTKENHATTVAADATAENGEQLKPLAAGTSTAAEGAASESSSSANSTTTIATQSGKVSKKVKVKRKKAQIKADNSTKGPKKGRVVRSVFSSDSEDERPLISTQKKQKQLQRAPRLLLTKTPAKLNSLSSSAVTPAHGSDNIGLSSSDNELPNLVNAAIKCVESDTDDTNEVFGKAKAKNLPQYQSLLLQDFNEKTQRLGQSPGLGSSTTPLPISATVHIEQQLANLTSNSQSDSIASSAGNTKKRRGRPRKCVAAAGTVVTKEATVPAMVVNAATLNINESADSGVISTTSTTQSATPSPRISSLAATAPPAQPKSQSHIRTRKRESEPVRTHSPTKSVNEAESPKPKLDMAYLDKRMYATERVLYPPPRNKRRQTSSAAAAALQKSTTNERKLAAVTKEELQLDPVWRKIDVNKKFRRPSVTSGYKSDVGGNHTVCSKILAAKSGYVSDYGSFHLRSLHHNSGYKSDASVKSRYSTKSCASRRSRAKSCGYRSDCKENASVKSGKYRRKRRTSVLSKTHSKSVGNLNDEQDILQLAGLSLGQSSEESNEYVCKPNLKNLPTTSVSKKYGEINRYIATGEYFSRGSTGKSFGMLGGKQRAFDSLEDGSQDSYGFNGKVMLQRKNSLTSEQANEMLLPLTSRKIKSRRSSAASYCSSFYSTTSKVKRRHRRKSFRFPSSSKSGAIDSKLLTEIEILSSTFTSMCRIISSGTEKSSAGQSNGKDKPATESTKAHGSSASGRREGRDKRSMKKRKMSENLDFALLANNGGLTPSSVATKRRHKKSSSSSPDDHKLPLKKRHYLLTPGEKSTEAAVAAKLFASKSAKAGLTPKKRHLLQNSAHSEDVSSQSIKGSNSSPLRVVVDTNSISGGKLLDISPISLGSLKQATEAAVHKKRSRLEGYVTKMTNSSDEQIKDGIKGGKSQMNSPMLDSETSCPPPGVFEPSVELEIQIPPIAKLSDTATAIITKSEVDSPLLLDIHKTFATATTKTEGTRVVEVLLSKTSGSVVLKRKRKKINRTGFPTVKRKRRKVNETLDPTLDFGISCQEGTTKTLVLPLLRQKAEKSPACERVPQVGESSGNFVERNNRKPRLSVVALERLQGTLTPMLASTLGNHFNTRQRKSRAKGKEEKGPVPKSTSRAANAKPTEVLAPPKTGKKRGRKAKVVVPVVEPPPVKETQKRGRKSDAIKMERSPERPTVNARISAGSVKLPDGVDPNTNFRCKIRLKRRSAIQPVKAAPVPTTPTPTEAESEDVSKEAAGKDSSADTLEQDILPFSEALHATDSGATSDTSDEKVHPSKRVARLRKTYLAAGLFSDHFKVDVRVTTKFTKKGEKKDSNAVSSDNGHARLPAPPYCEKYFRRTRIDFVLPFDIWWAYKNAKLPTRITVPSWNYRKIRTNVYAESVRPNMTGIDHPMCNCQAEAGCGDNCLNRMVYTECSPSNCPSRDSCLNQKIQRHEVAPGVERFMTEDKGWGVRTKVPIEKGTYILEYVGEVVTEREFKDRMGTIYLNDIHHYCLHLDGGLVIDGHRMGSDGRFVNHSCMPNCEMQKWSVNGLSRMALFAKRQILPDEELTYDYNFSLFNPAEGQTCHCHTPQCRGVIGGKSQRIKPLPIEAKGCEAVMRDSRGRQRKRKAQKNKHREHVKDVVLTQMQQLTEKEKKYIQQHAIFPVRTFEKIRSFKAKRKAKDRENASSTQTGLVSPAAITNRRPSTPSSLAAQISALCSPRSIKTRGLTQAAQDPEVEKMAKIAVVLREICTALESFKDPEDENVMLINVVLFSSASTNKKKKLLKPTQKQEALDLKTVQANIEQGHYKNPSEFDSDMQKIFADAKQLHSDEEEKLKALEKIATAYEQIKHENYAQLLELVNEEKTLTSFRPKTDESLSEKGPDVEKAEVVAINTPTADEAVEQPTEKPAELDTTSTEDIIGCICGLYKDEGLMIQCARCMVWQHTECTKADINADNYHCEKCDPREVDREIPLEDFNEDGHRYYLSLMRGELQVRQGDAVYVLRDIPVKDSEGNVIPKKKHTYETIGSTDYSECDIFRVERLWKNSEGSRFIFGHHFLRPHETFHEPSRRFYPNEVVRVPLYEVVPIELVIGRCWVLDRTTFCKGRPIECDEEEHCYICELRVDKSARLFARAKATYPVCTKSYAFRKFPERIRISKTYAPHDVDPSLLKIKKQKSMVMSAAQATQTSRGELSKSPHSMVKRGALAVTDNLPLPPPQTVQTVKEKRLRLENVLKAVKLQCSGAHSMLVDGQKPMDLTYLLTGRGARQRKHNPGTAAPASGSNGISPS